MFLDALESYPDEVPIYEACIAFYLDTEQPQEVSGSWRMPLMTCVVS